jgi:response regulator RpfG family c-di-GMP phosphodiesterase
VGATEEFRTTPGQPDESMAFRTQIVLVVDDEADILESLKDLLERSLNNLKVVTAESGPAALRILKSEPVDLIVTDYKMPVMNGLEFLSEAIKITPATPRVLITAFPDLELAIKAINDAQIENFSTKPLEPEAIVEVVRAILYERRAKEFRNRAFARSLEQLRRQLKTRV